MLPLKRQKQGHFVVVLVSWAPSFPLPGGKGGMGQTSTSTCCAESGHAVTADHPKVSERGSAWRTPVLLAQIGDAFSFCFFKGGGVPREYGLQLLPWKKRVRRKLPSKGSI